MDRRVVAALGALLGCGAGCDWDFERMIDQPKFVAYEPNPYFADGTTMQHPPQGTVSRSAVLGPVPLVRGVVDGAYVTRVPVTVTKQLLLRGRNRYRIFCAVCHGTLGDGDTPVAADMKLRPPPALISPPIAGYSPGRLYSAVTRGYGLMPSYREELSVTDRWAVVAYVQALQLSQAAPADSLPARLRKELP